MSIGNSEFNYLLRIKKKIRPWVGSIICSELRKKKHTSLGGLEPPTFRLTAERANRLRHRDELLPWFLNFDHNIPIQIYWKFYHQKRKFSDKNNSDILHNSAQNIDCGYSLEPPHRGGSNEYPQSMFLSRNKKINVYPCKPQFYYIKLGFKGSQLYRHVLVMYPIILWASIFV